MNRSPRQNKRRLVIVGLIILILGLAVYFLKPKSLNSQSSERLGIVAREALIQRVTIAGTAEPIRTTTITPPYDGYVKKIFVKLGQKIKSGDPVVSLAQSLQSTESVFPIRAPFSGTVTQVLKTEGQFLKQNEPRDAIVRIDDLTKISIYANAAEIDVVKIRSGLEGVVKVSALLTRSYKGIVREISLAATPREQWGGKSQVEYLVKIEITDADSEIKPGMTAVVDIITSKKEGVLTLGHEFIQKENEDYFAFMKDGSKRKIKIGLQNESVFEVVSGLNEGEEVQQVDFLKLIEKQ